MRVPLQTKLRTALLVVALALTLSTGAAARSTDARASHTRDASAKPSQEEPRVVDTDAVKAEELCERGEALSKQGDTRRAVEASGEAVKLYRSIYHAIRLPPPSSGPEPLARYHSVMAARLRRAPECIDLYTRLGGGANAFERSQLEALRNQAQDMAESDPSRVVLFGRETDTPMTILQKPEPRFPREERGKHVSVTVRVRVVLTADGEVKHALVVTEQPRAFSESSVEAAKAIKFKPAVKDGRAVSQFVLLEYGFQSF
ncbi:MAG: energy transducer TonB [Pyrinomonadaceae bacterium]